MLVTHYDFYTEYSSKFSIGSLKMMMIMTLNNYLYSKSKLQYSFTHTISKI